MLVTGNNPSTAYRLSIRVFTGGFSLSTYQGDAEKPLEQEVVTAEPTEMAAQLTAALSRPRFTNYSYSEVQLIICEASTRIPLEEFRRDEIAAIYRLTFTSSPYHEGDIRYEILKELEVAEIFPLSQEVEQAVRTVYPDVQIHSLQGSCLESDHALSNQPGRKPHCFFAHIQQDLLLVSLFHQGKLQFACSYPVKIDSDRLYFLLYAWKTLNLKNQQSQCVLSGASDKLISELSKYILYIDTCA